MGVGSRIPTSHPISQSENGKRFPSTQQYIARYASIMEFLPNQFLTEFPKILSLYLTRCPRLHGVDPRIRYPRVFQIGAVLFCPLLSVILAAPEPRQRRNTYPSDLGEKQRKRESQCLGRWSSKKIPSCLRRPEIRPPPLDT